MILIKYYLMQTISNIYYWYMTSVITYSPAFTIVPTYECFNRCSYCNFRVDLGKGYSLSLEDVAYKLQKLDSNRIAEILVLSGEVHPSSSARKKWFTKIHVNYPCLWVFYLIQMLDR